MRSIRVYLFALVATCLLLAAAAFVVVLSRINEINRQHAEVQTLETARALSQAVDREVERALGILSVLSTSDAAIARDWTALERQARAALKGGDAWIVVHDRSGRQLLNTGLPAGAEPRSGPPPVQMWRAIDSGKPYICDLTQGLVADRIVCVDVPIGPVGAPEHAISIIFRPQIFGSIVARENVGVGNIATLVDRSGRVIWRNIKPEEFVGRQATGDMMQIIGAQRRSAVLESKSLEGVEMLSGLNRSELSGWSVIVGTPLEQVNAASRQALQSGFMLALAIILLGGAFAILISAKVVSAVNRLVGVAADDDDGGKSTGITEIDSVAETLRASAHARAESERHQQMLIGELNHRVKNTLSIVQSLAHQTFRPQASPTTAISAFEGRLKALAAAHNLLTQQRWEAASMAQIVRTAMAPFCGDDRCQMSGTDVQVSPQTSVSLALALHELATNAAKYGALSKDDGKVFVGWTVDGEEFSLTWREVDGPAVHPPKTDGFGMRLIKRSLASELGGKVNVDFLPDGLRCTVTGRLNRVTVAA